MLKDDRSAVKFPISRPAQHAQPEQLHIISMGNLCRWLAEQAVDEVNLFPGFPAGTDHGTELCPRCDHQGTWDPPTAVKGASNLEWSCAQSMCCLPKAAGGASGKTAHRRVQSGRGRDPQHYGIGIKGCGRFRRAAPPGLGCTDPAGHWTRRPAAAGFSTIWKRQVAVGLIVDLNYANPTSAPFDGISAAQAPPTLRHRHLEGGKRITYGARALTRAVSTAAAENALSRRTADRMRRRYAQFRLVKGGHTCNEVPAYWRPRRCTRRSRRSDGGGQDLDQYEERMLLAPCELKEHRNFGPAMHKFGPLMGGTFNWLSQVVFRGRLPLTLHDKKLDYQCLKPAADCTPIEYPKPDGKISFDKLSSVYLSNTNHERTSPCHLQLADPDLPLRENLPRYAEPAQRYCPCRRLRGAGG